MPWTEMIAGAIGLLVGVVWALWRTLKRLELEPPSRADAIQLKEMGMRAWQRIREERSRA